MKKINILFVLILTLFLSSCELTKKKNNSILTIDNVYQRSDGYVIAHVSGSNVDDVLECTFDGNYYFSITSLVEWPEDYEYNDYSLGNFKNYMGDDNVYVFGNTYITAPSELSIQVRVKGNDDYKPSQLSDAYSYKLKARYGEYINFSNNPLKGLCLGEGQEVQISQDPLTIYSNERHNIAYDKTEHKFVLSKQIMNKDIGIVSSSNSNYTFVVDILPDDFYNDIFEYSIVSFNSWGTFNIDEETLTFTRVEGNSFTIPESELITSGDTYTAYIVYKLVETESYLQSELCYYQLGVKIEDY